MAQPEDPHKECKEYSEALKFKIKELEQKVAILEELVKDADIRIDQH